MTRPITKPDQRVLDQGEKDIGVNHEFKPGHELRLSV